MSVIPSVSAIRSVTVGVSRIDTALELFRDAMGLQVEFDDPNVDMTHAWALPPGTRVRLVELSCAGYEYGRLRLAEYRPFRGLRVRDEFGGPDSAADVGPKAIDFYVRPRVSLERTLNDLRRAGAVPQTRPVTYEVGSLVSEEAVVAGPDGLPMLLMRAVRHPASSLRADGPVCAFSEIPTVSIIAGDLDESTSFYETVLGYSRGTDAPIKPELQQAVAELTGVPGTAGIYLRLVRNPSQASGKVLLIRFKGVAQSRLRGRMRPGNLGISLYTCQVDGLDAMRRSLEKQGLNIYSRPAITTTAGERRRVMLVPGPDEVLFEFFEPTD
jgi:catechol 2,3-dioxygenase-like lactoylglutathione lyase family enzyme